MNFVNKFILHTKKNVTSWKKINTEMQGFKRGSPIKPHVKMGPLVTHPARVADFEDSSFRSICALSSTRTMQSYTMVNVLRWSKSLFGILTIQVERLILTNQTVNRAAWLWCAYGNWRSRMDNGIWRSKTFHEKWRSRTVNGSWRLWSGNGRWQSRMGKWRWGSKITVLQLIMVHRHTVLVHL
jgi:hypothetical protein